MIDGRQLIEFINQLLRARGRSTLSQTVASRLRRGLEEGKRSAQQNGRSLVFNAIAAVQAANNGAQTFTAFDGSQQNARAWLRRAESEIEFDLGGGAATGGIFGRIGDFIGGLLPGGGGDGGGSTGPGFIPDLPIPDPIAPGPGPGGGGSDPVDLLPSGIRNILDNISDIQELLQNPTAANFLRALDVTTANQILDFFGIAGDASELQQPSDTDPSPPMNGQPDNGTMQPFTGGGFQGSLMLEILQDSISSKNGKAILQAITGGHLQDGVIQQPDRVQYGERGVHHVSPPGFRTIEVGGEDFAVFIPLARALNMMPSDGRTELQRLDDLARKFQSARSDVEKLAPKVGLKTSNRKSGPRR